MIKQPLTKFLFFCDSLKQVADGKEEVEKREFVVIPENYDRQVHLEFLFWGHIMWHLFLLWDVYNLKQNDSAFMTLNGYMH